MHDSTSPVPQKYFFRVYTNGLERHVSEGLQFNNKREAWHEASMSTGEIIRDMDGKIETGLDWRMDVTDAAGKLIYRFSFKAEEI